MSYKLFIDDERFPPGRWFTEGDYLIARSSADAIKIVSEFGMPTFISFDHDLGGDDTSRIFINWLVDQLLDKKVQFPPDFLFSVHSQNPVGAQWIHATMYGIIQEFQ